MSEQPPPGNATSWRLGRVEKTIEELEKKVDRLTMAIVGGSVTLTVAAVVFAFTWQGAP